MTAIGCRNSKSTWLRLACALAFAVAAVPAIAADLDVEEAAVRREKIAEMSEFERNSLVEKQARFLAMSRTEQDAIRRLHEELEADARADGSLNGVLRNYQAWLKKLSPWERAEIRAETDPEERIALIRRLKEQEGNESDQTTRPEPGPPSKSPDGSDARKRRGPTIHLAEADFQHIIDVIAKSLALSDDEQNAWAKLPPSHRHIKILMKALERQRPAETQAPRERWPSVELTKRILEVISDGKTRERLEDPERTLDQRRGLLRSLIFGALMRESSDKLKKQRPSDEQMLAYFRDLDPEERDKLMRQWGDGHRQRLVWRYLEEKGDSYTRDLVQFQKAFAPRFGRGDGRPPGADRPRRGRPDGDNREGFPRRPPSGRDVPSPPPKADGDSAPSK